MAKSPSRYRHATVIRRGYDEYLGIRPTYDTGRRVTDRFIEVRPGDSLQMIAYRELGDARLWWVVADFNGVVDPFSELETGSLLRVPSRARLWMEILR